MISKTKLLNIYRSLWFQATVIGLISFTQPGIRSAIGSLGAGGLANRSTSNISNAIMFGLMTLFAPVFALSMNKVGVIPIAVIGGMGGVFVSSALYVNSKTGNQWYIILGSAISGVFTAAFWASEAFICLVYPTDTTRGTFIGIWQGISKIGGIFAGAIAFSLNLKGRTVQNSVSLNTYIVLFSIQCLGPFLALLLTRPEKLYRPDGKILRTNVTQETVKERLQSLKRVLLRREILILTPTFLIITFWKPFESNYASKYFTVRARGLNSLLSAVVQMLTDFGMAIFFDNKWTSKKTKVKLTWIIVNILMVAFYIYAIIIQNYLAKNPPQKKIDWDDPLFKRTYIPNIIFYISGEASFNWLYWVIGNFHFSTADVSLISGIIRSAEALGQTVSYTVIYTHPDLLMNICVAAGLYFITTPLVTYGVWKYIDNESSEVEYISDGDTSGTGTLDASDSSTISKNKEKYYATVV